MSAPYTPSYCEVCEQYNDPTCEDCGLCKECDNCEDEEEGE